MRITALALALALGACTAVPAQEVRVVDPEPCLDKLELHEFLNAAGARPYAGGMTGGGPFVVWADEQGRWAAVGYPAEYPTRACLIAQGVQWVGPKKPSF